MGLNKTLLAGIIAGMGSVSVPASNVDATSSGTTITVTWTTTVAAYSRVQFGTVSGTYTGQVDDIVTAVTSHSVVLDASDGIVSGETYYYRVGSSLNGVSWTYSGEYSVVTLPPSNAIFDIAANALAGSWTNGQNITSLTSSNSADVLSGTVSRYPTYNSADESMRFSGTQVMSNESLPSFAEAILVVTDTGVNNFNYVTALDDSTNVGPTLQTSNNASQWYLSGGYVNGRLNGQTQILLVRVATDTVYLRTVGSGASDTEASRTVAGIPQAFTKFSVPERASQGNSANIIVHEMILCPALSAAERTSWISYLKTKWSI